MLSRLAKTGSSLILLLSLAMVVSACGRRGSLEAPSSAVSGTDDATVITADTVEEDGTAIKKPDKPFILDPLL